MYYYGIQASGSKTVHLPSLDLKPSTCHHWTPRSPMNGPHYVASCLLLVWDVLVYSVVAVTEYYFETESSNTFKVSKTEQKKSSSVRRKVVLCIRIRLEHKMRFVNYHQNEYGFKSKQLFSKLQKFNQGVLQAKLCHSLRPYFFKCDSALKFCSMFSASLNISSCLTIWTFLKYSVSI